MQLEANKLSIVGSKGDWLILTDPKTYNQYLCREFKVHSQSVEAFYLSLIDKKHPEMVEILKHKKMQPGMLLVFAHPHDATLKDLLVRAGSFRDEELLNTVEEILGLLQRLSEKGQDFGMLSAETICFCNGSIKFTVGTQTPRKQGESSLEADLSALGNLVLELAVGPKASKTSLNRVALRYSKKFHSIVSLLLDENSKNKLRVFQYLRTNPEESENKAEEKPESSKMALTETNHTKEMECSFESFKTKMRRIEGIVEECMEKSRRLMRRSENKLQRLRE